MVKQRNINFRQTKSERSAEGAYANFKKGLAKKLSFKDKTLFDPKLKIK